MGASMIGQSGGGSPAVPNASVGITGSTAPTSATEIGIIVAGNLVGVSATNPIPVTGTVTDSNPAIGLTGSPAPTSAIEIGIIDNGGNLRGVSSSNPLRIDPTGTTLQPVSGTITANQGTSPWVVSLASTTITGTVAVTQSTSPWIVAGGGTAGTAATGVVTVQGIAAMTPLLVTATFSAAQHVIVDSGTITAVTAITNALPAGTNVIGHIITDSGSTTAVTGTVTVQGAKTNNNAAPGATNIGTLPAIANAAAQTWAEGDQVALSEDLSGNLRVISESGSTTAVTQATAANLNAAVVGTKTNNNAAPGATNVGTLPGIANAATQTWTEGDQVNNSVDLSGRQRVRGILTNNNAAPAADQLSVLPALANAAAPSWTEGDQVLASVDLSGHQRVVATGAAAADAAQSGNPVLVAGVDSSGNIQELPVADAGTATPAQVLVIGGNDNTAATNITRKLGVDSGGGVSIGSSIVGMADGTANSNVLNLFDAVHASGAGYVAALGTMPLIFNGSTWDRQRVRAIFKTAQATASGNTAVWTPTTGKKFRVSSIFVQLTDNASLASGAVLTIDIRDSNTTTNITFDVFVPTTAVTTVVGDGLEQQLDLGPNGILSASANNVLNVNLSAALATGNVRIIAMGTEE